MIPALRRVTLACALCLSPLSAPAFAEEHGRVRLQDELRGAVEFNTRSLFAAPLPPGPAAASDHGAAHAISAYAPEQHVRLKQMNFTGAGSAQ
jgi:hypothetical protein